MSCSRTLQHEARTRNLLFPTQLAALSFSAGPQVAVEDMVSENTKGRTWQCFQHSEMNVHEFFEFTHNVLLNLLFPSNASFTTIQLLHTCSSLTHWAFQHRYNVTASSTSCATIKMTLLLQQLRNNKAIQQPIRGFKLFVTLAPQTTNVVMQSMHLRWLTENNNNTNKYAYNNMKSKIIKEKQNKPCFIYTVFVQSISLMVQ